jgi:hypothetical protein
MSLEDPMHYAPNQGYQQAPPQLYQDPPRHVTPDKQPTRIENSDPGRGWLYKALRWQYLLIFTVCDLALLIAIIALTVKSSKDQGFATLPPSSNTTSNLTAATSQSFNFNVSWDLGVLWTSLPNFVFGLFAAYWGWIATAISDRQPFLELRKDGGAAAQQSVLLDYRFIPIFWRWWTAFKRSHLTVGTTVMVALGLTYVTQPLSARLFALQTVSISREGPVIFNSSFGQANINSEIDWRPILDTVAATKLYRGGNIRWTDNQYAFRPFFPKITTTDSAVVAANTTAYAAYLNCELLTDYTLSLTRRDANSGTIVLKGSDRGCDIGQTFDVFSTQGIYLKTTAQLDCSSTAYFSRLVFTAATYSATSSNMLEKVSVISCATGYRSVVGILAISGTSSQDPAIQSFMETGTADTTRPILWRIFEQNIFGTTAFNPSTKWTTTDMGTLVLRYAQNLQPNDALSSQVLMRSISEIFTSVYLTGVAIHGFKASGEQNIVGSFHTPTTRLFVVPWVAYVIIIFLVIALVFVVVSAVQVYTSSSILSEEPQGLLAMAGILDKSGLLDTVERIHQIPGSRGQIRKTGKADGEIMNAKWQGLRDASSQRFVISPVEQRHSGSTVNSSQR